MSLPVTEIGASSVQPTPEPEEQRARVAGRSPLRIAFDRLRRDPVAAVCFGIVLVFTVIAFFPEFVMGVFGVSLETPLASERIDLFTGMPKEGPPLHGFDPDHPFGVSPKVGEDNLAVWLKGAQTSLLIAFIATAVSSVVGVTLGLLAGFLGGVVDRVISFVTDIFLTIPFILAALAIAPILSDRFGDSPATYERYSFYGVIAILSVFGWMSMCRLIRGEVLSLREREFVLAARVIGVPTPRLLVREVLPNLVAPIVVAVSLGLPAFVALEAGLSFLGIGVTGRPSWGQTVLAATPYYDNYPLYLWEPVLGIVVLVVALNLLGDAIRDALDPKTRR